MVEQNKARCVCLSPNTVGEESCVHPCVFDTSKCEFSCPCMSSREMYVSSQSLISQGIARNSLKNTYGYSEIRSLVLYPLRYGRVGRMLINLSFHAPIRRRVMTRLFLVPHGHTLSIPIRLSPSIFVGGQTGCLSGHQGLVESAVAELKRPAIGRWWRCSPFHLSIAWNGTSCAAKRQ